MAQCEICATEMTQGRGPARRTCSAACRQAAHRRRQAAEVTRLRAAATRPTPAPATPAPPPAPAVPDDSPAGRILAAGADLAQAVEAAARRAAGEWADPGLRADVMVGAVQYYAEKVAAAILASAPEPPAPTVTRPSRNEPEPQTKPASSPKRKRLSHKVAMAIVDTAQLVKADDHRDTSQWNLVADDGTILGHITPSYRGTSRTGWKYEMHDAFISGGPYKTRDDAALHCSDAWVRAATAPVRRTLTGRD
jgi:hypothetical protein